MTAAAAHLPSDALPGAPLSRGRVGMIGLIVAETSLIGVFVVAYLFYIGKSLHGPYPKEVLETPIVGTICLLSSSFTIALAVRAFRGARGAAAVAWLALTILLGGIFLGGTALEWRRLIVLHGLTISTNLFGTTFYSLVGLHAAHVTVGLVLLLVILVCALRGALRPIHAENFELVSWYWHFVDVVWVVVFTVVYGVGR
jgi:cytochrome c oxidase subunit 3/cytochrome o ubiquinol oxidase subunit 3